MNSNTHILADAVSVVRESVADLLVTGAVRSLSDDELRALAINAGHLLRSVEAALIDVAGEVEGRSQSAAREERFTVRHGCARMSRVK